MEQDITINKSKTVNKPNNHNSKPASTEGGDKKGIIVFLIGVTVILAAKCLWDKISDKKESASLKEGKGNHTVNINYHYNINICIITPPEKKTEDSQQWTEPETADSFSEEETGSDAAEFVPGKEETKADECQEKQTFNIKMQATQFMGENIRVSIIYDPLPLPELFEQYKAKSLNEAFEKLYSMGNNTFFQCSRQEFRYWFGGTMGINFNAETECKRIHWKKGKYALQYFTLKLYRINRQRLPKNMWDKVGNIFLLDNEPIPPKTLGKNIKKVGKEDKREIDKMIAQFSKDMKRKNMAA